MEEKTKIPSISVRTRKILWGRSGHRCAMCEVKTELIEDIGLEGDTSIVGDEAHIVAKEKDGPRGESDYPMENRNDYENLMILCKKHHKIIDDHPDKYTIELLKEIKSNHEQWVNTNLGRDDVLEKDIIIYLHYLEFIENKMNFKEWRKQCMYIIADDNVQMKKVMIDNFLETLHFIQNRIWPKRYIELEKQIQDFSKIINDFIKIFSVYSEKNGDQKYETRKFHKIQEWNHEKYHKLSRKHDYHNYLLIDLLLELTRSGNQIIHLVRRHISYFYKIHEGLLTIEIGNYITGTTIYKVEYKHENGKPTESYTNLAEFAKEREFRDMTYEEKDFEEYIGYYTKTS